MPDGSAPDGIVELEEETLGGPNASDGGKGAAEHRGIVSEHPTGVLRNQFPRIEECCRGPFLVEPFLLAHDRPRPEDERVPMPDDVVEGPELRRQRLVADLLRNRDAGSFQPSIGVVGSRADPEPSALTDDDRFHFPAPALAQGLDLGSEGQPRC